MSTEEHTRTQTSVHIQMTPAVDPQHDLGKRALQDYTLPPIVKLALDTDLKQASAFPLITALFAGGLLTLAGMVPDDRPNDTAWGAWQFFIYSAIILNLSGTFLCLMIIKMCTDLPHQAQQMVVSRPASWPSRAAHGEPLPEEFLTDHWKLLSAFGMSLNYQRLDALFFFVVVFGGLYSFVAVILWVWLTEPHAVAGITMLTVVPAIASMMFGLVAAGSGEGWH